MDIEHVGSADQSIQLVVFALGEEEYGIPIQFVKEIIRKPEVTQLPNAPKYILGVINLRGQIIPIICMHTRFNLGSTGDSEMKVVIVEYSNLTVGLQVNEVSEVLTLSGNLISAAPAMTTTIDSGYISGVGKLENRLLIILDVERILSEEENAMLGDMMDERKA
ncbi:purine-binding chemotaxis protein CheW [bacterium]|nr:purine-binding chemotaxis protein CheW [bacterium]